jgi:hypothetical protein
VLANRGWKTLTALAYVALFVVGCTVSFLVGRFCNTVASSSLHEDSSNTRIININNYSQIGEGMKEPEVEALLGAPPGWYTRPNLQPVSGPLLAPDLFTSIGHPNYDGTTVMRGWADGDLAILVSFDAQGKVTTKTSVPLVRYFN